MVTVHPEAMGKFLAAMCVPPGGFVALGTYSGRMVIKLLDGQQRELVAVEVTDDTFCLWVRNVLGMRRPTPEADALADLVAAAMRPLPTDPTEEDKRDAEAMARIEMYEAMEQG